MRKNELRLTFRKGDFFVIAFVAAIAILVGTIFWTNVNSEAAGVVVIYQDGKMIQEIPLTEETEIMIEGAYRNKIVVEDGKAAIAESDCPGTDCVHSGWICQAGRNIVCLPNRVEVRIEGASEVDFVVR